MKKLLLLIPILLSGCAQISAINRMADPNYDIETDTIMKPTVYVDTRTPEQIEADKEYARKYVEDDDASWKKTHGVNKLNVPTK